VAGQAARRDTLDRRATEGEQGRGVAAAAGKVGGQIDRQQAAPTCKPDAPTIVSTAHAASRHDPPTKRVAVHPDEVTHLDTDAAPVACGPHVPSIARMLHAANADCRPCLVIGGGIAGRTARQLS
jgi:hypothetical protein